MGGGEFWIEEFEIEGVGVEGGDVIEIEFLKKLRNRWKCKKGDFWV